MILQLEDVIDVLRYKYENRFDYAFYFDHFSGHDRQRPDGLNSNAMNKGYGGVSNRKMYTSLIKDSSYLDTFYNNNTLQVGDVQHMAFQDEDDGPFWMTPKKTNYQIQQKYCG